MLETQVSWQLLQPYAVDSLSKDASRILKVINAQSIYPKDANKREAILHLSIIYGSIIPASSRLQAPV